MLEAVIQNQIIYYVMGAAVGIGILSKVISQITLRRLVRAARKMNKSNHKLMRLVKAKFEHVSMISDKVQNVEAFVKKYIYEYKVAGIRLHTWRQIEKKSIWAVGILGLLGAMAEYQLNGMGEHVLQYGAWTGIGVIALFVVHISTDEPYYLRAAENYMIDFLENVCAHRYSKAYKQKEEERKAVIQMEEAFAEEEFEEKLFQEEIIEEGGVEAIKEELEGSADEQELVYAMKEEEPEREEKETVEEKRLQELQVRRILEEFLA